MNWCLWLSACPEHPAPTYAAARILSDVVGSQRADLYGLVPLGKALGTDFGLDETYPKASVGFALAAVPAGADPAPITAEMKTILAGYADKGVPAALVEAAKKSEIAGAEFQQNSITDLAASWSQALAGEGRESPADIVEAMKKVTLADVNRVAKTYLSVESAIVATLKPSASGEAVAGKGFGGAEVTTAAPTKPVALPDWAEASVKSLKVPQAPARPADLTLSNGLRLIVRTEKASPTVTVIGSVKHEPDLQTPAAKEGADEVLAELFSYGTETRDRLAFQEGSGRYRRLRERRNELQSEGSEARLCERRGIAGGQRTPPRSAAGRVPGSARPDGATRRRYAGQSGIPYESRAGLRAAAEERPGAAGGDASIGFGFDACRRQSLLRESAFAPT